MVEASEWAMLVPDCILLFIAIIAFFFTENATDATQRATLRAFFANILGSK